MKQVNYSQVKITGGFWKERLDLVRRVTVGAVYNRFLETGRFDAFKCDPNAPIKPHIYWDSDVAKWIEGVAYLTREKREPELEKIVDEVVNQIEKNRDTCGYFNSYYLVTEQENRFKNRDCHELYCLGHLIEAAVAYYESTGKDKLLKLVCDYADYVEKVFKDEKSAGFKTPGHEEIELALVRLYECTKEKRYLELARYFVDERGKTQEELVVWGECSYNQSHKPVREQETAEGHAVRAVYLYCAMADLALRYNDKKLKSACKKLFDNIATKRMYVTGGIGSSHDGEAFTVDYDLPNAVSYTESCAALGLVLFASRMMLLENDAKYADVAERALYNGFLSSISLDGKSFFYTNPLEIQPYKHTRNVSISRARQYDWLPEMQRKEVFDCSCCPPNIVRFIPSIGNLLYTYDENTIYVNQFMESRAEITIGDKTYTVEQKTAYPRDGKVNISVSGGAVRLAVRVPSWCDEYDGKTKNGYLYFEISDTGSTVSVDFHAKPRFIYANTSVLDNAGKCALSYGPVIFCMEGQDNECHLKSIVLDTKGEISYGMSDSLGVPTIIVDAFMPKSSSSLYSYKKPTYKKIKATLIPYFTFANRGADEMQVWHSYK